MSFMKYINTPRHTILDLFFLLLALALADILGTDNLHKLLIGIGLIIPAAFLSVVLERYYREKD